MLSRHIYGPTREWDLQNGGLQKFVYVSMYVTHSLKCPAPLPIFIGFVLLKELENSFQSSYAVFVYLSDKMIECICICLYEIHILAINIKNSFQAIYGIWKSVHERT